jgi:hypothetical protein
VEVPQGISELFARLLQLLPVVLWLAFWLWAVDWRKVWPVLAEGAWAPCVLLILVTAFVWSRIAPGTWDGLRLVSIANFWWQLLAVSGLAALALFAGWLQGQFDCRPLEVRVEPLPPAAAHGHGQDHGHGHH